MARIKSLIVQVRIDQAKRSHNCQANSRHRIEQGDVRLKVRNGRSWDHYCRPCAENIITRDIKKLNQLQTLNPQSLNLEIEKEENLKSLEL